jgi:hypothetical protein
MTLKRGDFVEVDSGADVIRAMVTLASPNGRSIMLMFDGMIGGFLGMCPASLEDDGQWRAINGMPLTITFLRPSESRSAASGRRGGASSS